MIQVAVQGGKFEEKPEELASHEEGGIDERNWNTSKVYKDEGKKKEVYNGDIAQKPR